MAGLGLLMALAGCGGDKTPPAPPPTYQPQTADRPADSPNETVTEGLGAADRSVYRMTVDAMVGQINGRPVYASEIFEQIGEESLIRLGATTPRGEFRRQVIELLTQHLRAKVQSELILAEAESSLTPEQQIGLLGMLRTEREKILAQFFGSEAMAQRGLQQQRGMTLDEYLEAKRQQVLVEKYLHEKLYPKIHVSRRKVERYYNMHQDEYNPEPTIAVRMIMVDAETEAAAVDTALASGAAFEQVAKEHSKRLASRGGLLPPFKTRLTQFASLKWPQVNEAVRALSEGEHTGRIATEDGFVWVCVDEVKGAQRVSLSEVYPQIENHLRAAELDRLSRKYNAELMQKGNFTPLNEMLASLIDIAMARYARPE